ncbi:MAG: metal-sulfur cluster assembly factor [Candidatus Shikimatogenerans sp. Tduv]|uniref:Iron-sulfur cluster assembly protein n=1 Tax=Candidatus Shikimatogenerans sp. Tduv TaxID=3158567 RepID=A0AAU7QR73_9FLAO
MEIKKIKKKNIFLKKKIIKILKTIYDPEIYINIYNLGLIYNIRVINTNIVYITMTLTNISCPMEDYFKKKINKKIKTNIKKIKKIFINMVFIPKWNKNMINKKDLIKLDLL